MGSAGDEDNNHYNYKGGLKAYWKKRTSRLRGRPLSSAVLGSAEEDSSSSAPRRRRRFFRLTRRIKIFSKIGSPRRWLVRLRDAYVSMMLRLASSAAVGYGPYGYGSDVAFVHRKPKEYDEKMLVDIYKKVLIAQGMAGAGAVPPDRHLAMHGKLT